MASSRPEFPGAKGEDRNASAPAKKKRKLDKYRAFELEEQKSLKTYENMESRIRKVVNIMYETLTTSPPQENMSYEIEYLRDRLLPLKTKFSLDPIYIGLFGSTGAGKSSLLNAIIDQQFFLPVSDCEACTSCMVQVSNRGENYEAKIHLLSLEEWKEELKNLVKLVKKPEEEDEEGEEKGAVGEAVRKIQALYGKDAEARPYGDLSRTNLLVNIPASKCILLKAAQAKELSDKLDPYIRCHNDQDVEEPAQDEVGTKMRLWPLIKYVEVTIPKSDVIPEGVVFMEIPGTGDYNSKRDEMWKESINKCSVIWVVSDIERVVGDRVHEVLLTESIKDYQGGMCSDIALVVTKSDKLQLDEYLRERRHNNKPIETKHDAILERNTTVKEKKSSGMKTKLRRTLPSHLEILQKPDLVYTVSATEYWREKYLTKEETEIPKLREYIRNIYLKEKKQLLMDYVTQALDIVLLAENFNSTQDMVNHYQQNDLETFVEEKIKALEEEIEKCFAQLEQPLNEGVKQAKLSHQKVYSQLLTTNIILSTLEREILTKKFAINQSIQLSIQSDLRTYYEEAAKTQGRQSCQKMQNILLENIERETQGGMFERAKEKMKMQLQELKNKITTDLQMDISTLLKLALSHWEESTERLPDFQDEYREIEEIHETLQRM